MAEIKLTKGAVALVDDADVALVGKWKWHVQSDGRYARRNTDREGKSVSIYMHRLIVGAPAGMDVDHINGNGLDNRRANLRVVTHAENLWNRRRPARGVSQRRGAWRATIDDNGRKIELGQFRDEATALAAREYAAAILRGLPFTDFDILQFAPIARKLLMTLRSSVDVRP